MYAYAKYEKLLKLKNDTSYRVAKKTGIALPTFTAWKKGVYVPKIDKLQKLANYFGVPVTYFLE